MIFCLKDFLIVQKSEENGVCGLGAPINYYIIIQENVSRQFSGILFKKEEKQPI